MSEIRTQGPAPVEREAIIDLLALPREIARDAIPLEQCPHAGNFSPDDPGCATCTSRMECEWLFHADEFSALAERPLEQIYDALRFATVYVESRILLSGHTPPRCRCAACRWLVQANEMLEARG